MARISVYVSDEMKSRMDALGDRVNWSETAQAAFESKLHAAAMPDDPDIDQVIERLRKSKAEFDHAALQQVREEGRRWAKRVATYGDLAAIGKLKLGSGPHFYEQVDRAIGVDDPGSSPWFDSYYSNEWPSDAYVEAWVEGVKDVWNAVADKL